MAIVYSYPQATPTLSDTVLGTQFDYDGNPTKSFLISDIANLVVSIIPPPPTPPSITGLVPYIGATQSANLGIYNLTANSIIKAGGTNAQYLMADGSVSTGPVIDNENYVRNTTDTFTATPKIKQIVTLSQVEYNALSLPATDTLYIIL